MVAFTHLIVLATAGFSAVSAMAISSRSLASDITDIQNAIDQLNYDVNAIDYTDSSTTATIAEDFKNLIDTISADAIAEEGQPTLKRFPNRLFNTLALDLSTLGADIEDEISAIQSTPGLLDVMESGVGTLESVVGAYINSVIGRLRPQDKAEAVTALNEILAGLQKVETKLSSLTYTASSA